MEKNSWFKKYAPYLIAILTFLVVCVVYFKPQYEGMALRQSDMIHVSGMNKDIKDHQQAYEEHPQWAGNMFGGMPSYLIDFPFDGRMVGKVLHPLFYLGAPAIYLFLAMLGFFFMLLCFRVDPWLSLIGGIAYGFSTYFVVIIGAGHITKMLALAYAPPLIGAIWMAYRRNIWLGAVLAGVFAALEIGANHLQITYYFLMIILALAINEGIRAYREKGMPRFIKASALLLLAAVLAVGANAVLLWYLNDYSKDSTRGRSELTQPNGEVSDSGLTKEYMTGWSYGKAETFNLFIPNFVGGTSAGGFSEDGAVAQSLTKYNARHLAPHLPGYWGGQPMTLGPVYIGAVVVFLFVLAMFILCGYKKWWIFGVTLLSLLLAWGHNLMWFTDLFYHVPLYNKFRPVSTILVIAEWALPLLAMLALQKIWSGRVEAEKFKKSLKYTLIITGGIALFFALLGPSLFSFAGASDGQMGLPDDVLAAMRDERASMLRGDSLRSLVFVLLTAALVWLFYNRKVKKALFVGSMAVLVLVDMVGVDLRFLNYDSFMPIQQAKAIEPTEANLAILEDREPGYRVANFTVSTFSDAETSYFHRSIGGYHAAKLRRYQDLIDRHLSKMNWSVYNMLNTKYLITSGDDGQPVVQLNPDAMGAAWFVPKLVYVANPDEEIAALDRFDPATTAFVDQRFRPVVGERTDFPVDSMARIALTDYKVNHLTYRYQAPTEQLALFSEIYYPKGWTAYVDGAEAPHFRADYVLRGMILPAGEHTVEFVYKVPHYGLLVAVTYTCSFLLLGGLVVGLILRGRRKPNPME